MRSMFSPAGLAEASSRRPWVAIGAWIVAIVIAVGILGTLGLKTTTEFTFTNDPESQAGLRLLEDAGLVVRSRSEGDRRRTYVRVVTEVLESAVTPALAPAPVRRGRNRCVRRSCSR